MSRPSQSAGILKSLGTLDQDWPRTYRPKLVELKDTLYLNEQKPPPIHLYPYHPQYGLQTQTL